MASKIIVPEKFLDQIRRDAKREVERDAEVDGILLGLYEEDDSIVVSRMCRLPSLEGSYTLKSEVRDTLKIALCLPLYFNGLVIQPYTHRLIEKAKGKTPAVIRYHSHPMSTWSDYDLKHPFRLAGIVTAEMLYVYSCNMFGGLNNNGQPIHVYQQGSLEPLPTFIW